jgi:hypothetical protein
MIESSEKLLSFIYKLFPYQSLFPPFDEDTLTGWWVLIVIVYFAISTMWLWIKSSQIRKLVRRVAASFSVESIRNNDLLQEEWWQYAQTFLSQEGERQRTNEEAEVYFNEQNILAHRLDLRYWQALPGIFLGLGILGTFVGLTFGIAGFDTTEREKIEVSIQTLLSGMGTAFVTSVWGMFFSIIFEILEKRWFKKVSEQIKQLCRILDRQFKMTKADELRFANEDQIALFRQFFVFQTEAGHEVLPAYVLRDLLRNAEQQTRALMSFSTDLADGIRISTETINAFGTQIGEAIQRSFRIELSPTLDRLESTVQQLRQAREESSGAFIERVVSDAHRRRKTYW